MPVTHTNTHKTHHFLEVQTEWAGRQSFTKKNILGFFFTYSFNHKASYISYNIVPLCRRRIFHCDRYILNAKKGQHLGLQVVKSPCQIELNKGSHLGELQATSTESLTLWNICLKKRGFRNNNKTILENRTFSHNGEITTFNISFFTFSVLGMWSWWGTYH